MVLLEPLLNIKELIFSVYSTAKSVMINRSSHIIKNARRWRTAASALKQYYFPETIVTTLPSNFRVATENTGIPTATIGVWIDAGSRYENEKNNGTAHFLEHMAFKGTPRRTQTGLELEVENIGAHLNAYTSREQTVYYAKCFSGDLEHSVDILSDILLHSRLGTKEIERERDVILREQQEVEQNFQEVVFDHLHSGVFEGNPLSMTILGSTNNIKTIQRSDLVDYIKTHYTAGRMVLAASGGVDHDQVVKMAEKYFGDLPMGDAESEFHEAEYKPCELLFPVKGMDMMYGAVCVKGVSWSHPDNLTLMVANTIIGEWDRSRGIGVNGISRLAQRVGLGNGVQSFQAFNTCYKDIGLLGVYFVCAQDSAVDLMNAVADEWRWLAENADEAIVERGKRTLLTNLLLMLDGSTPITEDIGRQLLCYGRRIPIPELEYRIKSVTAADLREVCQKTFVEGRIATTVVGSVGQFPPNADIEARLKGN